MKLIVGFCILLRVYPLMLFLKPPYATIRKALEHNEAHMLPDVKNKKIYWYVKEPKYCVYLNYCSLYQKSVPSETR
jgi:hypothetical protein